MRPLRYGSPDSRVELFNSFVESGEYSDLLTSLKDDTEPITPAQTTLLKLVDSYLAQPPHDLTTTPKPHLVLVELFKDYVRYTLISLGSGHDDARLPKVLEGLLLVVEGLSNIGLAAQYRIDSQKFEANVAGKEKLGQRESDDPVIKAMKADDGIIKPLIGKCMHLFAPELCHQYSSKISSRHWTSSHHASSRALRRHLPSPTTNWRLSHISSVPPSN